MLKVPGTRFIDGEQQNGNTSSRAPTSKEGSEIWKVVAAWIRLNKCYKWRSMMIQDLRVKATHHMLFSNDAH